MQFTAKGHENIRARHRTTLEFTKDEYVTLRGDCILGICADFGHDDPLRGKIRVDIKCGGVGDSVVAEANPLFDSHEMVIRKSDFRDKRTFAVHADKAACDLDRELVECAKAGKQLFITVTKI